MIVSSHSLTFCTLKVSHLRIEISVHRYGIETFLLDLELTPRCKLCIKLNKHPND